MNFKINNLPERTAQPRNNGLTMVMDKGLSLREVDDFLETNSDYVDIVKLGFGTSYLTKNFKQKIEKYKNAGMKLYMGGTLFEAFLVRNQEEDYYAICDDYGFEYVEISDGSIELSHERKCALISKFAQKFVVLSEVGSKDGEKIIPPYKWIDLMQKELNAGATYLIAEAREAGNVGIYRNTGEVREGLIDEILTKIPAEKIIFEAPQKSQQVWFIKLLGANVNLGNIAPNDVIPLETLRLGLRADTFTTFLNGEAWLYM
jgi:phosphosulfolactate synthase